MMNHRCSTRLRHPHTGLVRHQLVNQQGAALLMAMLTVALV